ncbi:hypothetical protein [Actinacidiphila sp. bgisy167]|uniref:hypothetical protein n=1 Tax=Actinacidiphila sp. bgisy167 TaxID=3413797 RepID=UPI003D74E83A
MDAGTAAVLGALAGSVATVGAALATGWAQREGARIAVRAEHRRERREPRLAAYKEFISVASAFRSESSPYTIPGLIPDDLEDEAADSISEAAAELKRSAMDVALAGPRRVSKDAIRIERLGNHLAISIRLFVHFAPQANAAIDEKLFQRMRRRGVVSLARKVNRAIDTFLLRAQAALDDDGSLGRR